MAQCLNCHYDNVRVAKFCIECGTRLATQSLSQQERKKVTILFADVSGFTALSEQMDPEELTDITSEIYKVMGSAVYKYGGTVDKYLGDGVMVLFGAPKAHENDNERALLCALEIRKQLQSIWVKHQHELRISIGINAGIVISGKVGDDQRQDFTALGEVVNVAKRFEESAKGGQILVSESIYRDLKTRFEWEPFERIRVKGKSEMLKVYELSRVASQKDLELLSGAGLAKLVGRDAEIRELEACLDRVCRGESVEMGLFGEAGLGKSRMIYELRYFARKRDISLLRAAGTSHTQTQSFHIFDNLMRNYLGLNQWEDASTALRRIESLLENFGDDSDKHERVGAIAWMMGYQYEAATIEHLSADRREKFIAETLLLFLRKEASKSPTLMIFDDLHWIDPASARLLTSLRESSSQFSMGLLLSGRQDEIPVDEISIPHHNLYLKPFTHNEMEEYLKSILVSTQLPVGLVDMLFSKSKGNPFFAEELVKKLLIERVIQRQGARFVLTKPLDDVPTPLSVQELLMSRIDLLDAEQKRVLQCAAVIGESFPKRVLKSITDQYSIELEDCLDPLLETQMIVRKSLGEDEEFVFKHSLLQNVAYSSLLRKHQRDIHLKVAHAFESLYPEQVETFYRMLAFHYEKAGMIAQAANYLLEEVEMLFDRGEGSLAREALTQVRHLNLDRELQIDLLLDQVRLELLLGIGLLEENLDGLESDDPRILLRMTQLRALVSTAIDRESLINLASLTGEIQEIGVSTLLQSWTCLRIKNFDKAEELALLAKSEFVENSDRVGQAMALEALGLASRGRKDHELANGLIEESLQVLGSDAKAQLGWLRLNPLVFLLGHEVFTNLISIAAELDRLEFSGLEGYFLEDIEVVSRVKNDELFNLISSTLSNLFSKQREGLLRLLSFRGQVDLVIRPCVYWIIKHGELPSEMTAFATPGTFLSHVARMIKIERLLEVDRELVKNDASCLIQETNHLEDGQRADILALTGSYLVGGAPSEVVEGRSLIKRAIHCLEERPKLEFRDFALQRLRGFGSDPSKTPH